MKGNSDIVSMDNSSTKKGRMKLTYLLGIGYSPCYHIVKLRKINPKRVDISNAKSVNDQLLIEDKEKAIQPFLDFVKNFGQVEDPHMDPFFRKKYELKVILDDKPQRIREAIYQIRRLYGLPEKARNLFGPFGFIKGYSRLDVPKGMPELVELEKKLVLGVCPGHRLPPGPYYFWR